MTEPMATTSTTAPGAAGRRVGHEDIEADQSPYTHGTTEPTAAAVVKSGGHHDGPRIHRSTGRMILLVVLCFFLPPVAVGLEEGCGNQVFLNVVLLILGWIPAIIHSLFIVCA